MKRKSRKLWDKKTPLNGSTARERVVQEGAWGKLAEQVFKRKAIEDRPVNGGGHFGPNATRGSEKKRKNR